MTKTSDRTGVSGAIAIDGPAASGKSTVARRVAERLGGCYVSTGDMYRAISWESLRRGIAPLEHPDRIAAMLDEISLECVAGSGGLPRMVVDGTEIGPEKLHSPQVADRVSDVAAIPAVRSWLVERQRATARLGLVVLEGRDIGTVIFPDARHKFFLTATPEERARRRLAQGGDVPDNATIESVAAQIARRDHIDSTRKVAPLKAADDALVIDSTGMSVDQVVDLIVRNVTGR